MDMPAGIPVSLPERMEIGGSEGGFTSGAQSTSILGGRNQPWEMVSNASEAVIPMAVTINTATHHSNAMVDTDQLTNQRRRKRQHRHSLQQIQELETFFRACPHPDENQRNDLGRALGMEPIQIKFWFQNKRTQLKALNERQYNSQLRMEYEKLQVENLKYKKALATAYCRQCGVPCINEFSLEEHQLKLENVQLREEIDRITSIAARFARMPLPVQNIHVPPPLAPFTVPPFQAAMNLWDASSSTTNIYGSNGEIMRTINGPTIAEKPVITELALAAMDELLQMAQLKEPLWVSSVNLNTVVLDKQEYGRFFSRGSIAAANPKGFKTEASCESAIVKINHIQLVEAFMNVDRWATMFSNIVYRAVTVGVISIGVAGNYDGALQVIYAEFQVPAPQVASRNYYFARYCKKNVDGTWAVVDVSIDRYLCMNRVGICLRRPSGCLIEELPNGYTKVTWVEHIEVDNDGNEAVSIYKPLLDSGMAFGAKRWITTLDQQCERIACARSINIPPTNDNLVIITPEGKKCILKLAKRMVISYMSGVSSSVTPQWKVLSGTGASLGDVRIMTRKILNEPGIPSGVLLSAATSFWLPLEPKRVFEFLNNKRDRNQWDILSCSGPLTKVARITYGREIGNSVTLLRAANSSQSKMMILQETSTNPTGSYVIYAPVDMMAMTLVSRGGDPKYVSLLPFGFAILPDGPPGTSSGGSLLTIAFQILVDSVPTAKLYPESVTTVNRLITRTVDRIKTCLFENRTNDPKDKEP